MVLTKNASGPRLLTGLMVFIVACKTPIFQYAYPLVDLDVDVFDLGECARDLLFDIVDSAADEPRHAVRRVGNIFLEFIVICRDDAVDLRKVLLAHDLME